MSTVTGSVFVNLDLGVVAVGQGVGVGLVQAPSHALLDNRLALFVGEGNTRDTTGPVEEGLSLGLGGVVGVDVSRQDRDGRRAALGRHGMKNMGTHVQIPSIEGTSGHSRNGVRAPLRGLKRHFRRHFIAARSPQRTEKQPEETGKKEESSGD
ncbi:MULTISPECIES: hypothetical protein [unclassified Streptomyces]|uniref:hypothetical protein n=1 Tax=Streptomyces sp. NPDC055082 TaxID=3365718 RepID=UPI0037D980D8